MNKKLKHGLSVVIPALNEEKFIGKTILKTVDAFKISKIDYEIFIVDDGSQDNTFQVAKKFAKKNKKIKVIRNKINHGMGNAIKICSRLSRYKYFLLIPGDDSFSKSGTKNLARAIGQADFIVGYRLNYPKIVPLFRKITFFSMRVIAFFLFGKFFKDVHASLIYPTKIIRKYNLKSLRYNFSIDLLNLMFLYKLNYKFVNVVMNKKTIYNTNAGTFKNIFSILLTVLRLKISNLKLRLNIIKLSDL